MVFIMGGQHLKKDNTGKRFGNMVVIGDSGIRQNRKVVWTCQCDCGEIFNTRSDHINTGKTTSCPKCAQKKNITNLLKYQNGIAIAIKPGDRYERLTFLEKTNRKNNNTGCLYYKCQCDCGNIVEIESRHWGETKSCGCYKKEQYQHQLIDLTGQRFGLLTVLSKSNKKSANGSIYWLCQCDCGTIKEIQSSLLRNHKVISCGCSKRSAGELKIYQLLIKNNINFEEQKTFDSCKFPNTNYPARYDFYLSDYNLLIEYDGEQHYSFREDNSFWNTKEEYEKIQYRDTYKTKWAEENNIKLKRIPYYDYDKITLDYILN